VTTTTSLYNRTTRRTSTSFQVLTAQWLLETMLRWPVHLTTAIAAADAVAARRPCRRVTRRCTPASGSEWVMVTSLAHSYRPLACASMGLLGPVHMPKQRIDLLPLREGHTAAPAEMIAAASRVIVIDERVDTKA
jgi:hypothetical protein